MLAIAFCAMQDVISMAADLRAHGASWAKVGRKLGGDPNEIRQHLNLDRAAWRKALAYAQRDVVDEGRGIDASAATSIAKQKHQGTKIGGRQPAQVRDVETATRRQIEKGREKRGKNRHCQRSPVGKASTHV